MTPTWDSTDFDLGTDDGVVHENTADTAYTNASEARKGDPTASPLYSADLEAWYPLQEPSGTTLVDFSGNGYNGTYNGVTLGGGDTMRSIPAHSWDGNDDFADTGQKFRFIHDGDFTISFWVWIPTDISSRGFLFDSGGGSSSNDGGYAVDLYGNRGSGQEIAFLSRYSGNSPTILVDASNQGEWIHAVNTMDASGNVNGETRGYKDGTKVDSSSNTPSEPNNTSVPNTLRIGEINGSYDLNYYGYVFDFRLYSRALSASEVKELYDVWANPSTHTSVVKSG